MRPVSEQLVSLGSTQHVQSALQRITTHFSSTEDPKVYDLLRCILTHQQERKVKTPLLIVSTVKLAFLLSIEAVEGFPYFLVSQFLEGVVLAASKYRVKYQYQHFIDLIVTDQAFLQFNRDLPKLQLSYVTICRQALKLWSDLAAYDSKFSPFAQSYQNRLSAANKTDGIHRYLSKQMLQKYIENKRTRPMKLLNELKQELSYLRYARTSADKIKEGVIILNSKKINELKQVDQEVKDIVQNSQRLIDRLSSSKYEKKEQLIEQFEQQLKFAKKFRVAVQHLSSGQIGFVKALQAIDRNQYKVDQKIQKEREDKTLQVKKKVLEVASEQIQVKKKNQLKKNVQNYDIVHSKKLSINFEQNKQSAKKQPQLYQLKLEQQQICQQKQEESRQPVFLSSRRNKQQKKPNSHKQQARAESSRAESNRKKQIEYQSVKACRSQTANYNRPTSESSRQMTRQTPQLFSRRDKSRKIKQNRPSKSIKKQFKMVPFMNMSKYQQQPQYITSDKEEQPEQQLSQIEQQKCQQHEKYSQKLQAVVPPPTILKKGKSISSSRAQFTYNYRRSKPKQNALQQLVNWSVQVPSLKAKFSQDKANSKSLVTNQVLNLAIVPTSTRRLTFCCQNECTINFKRTYDWQQNYKFQLNYSRPQVYQVSTQSNKAKLTSCYTQTESLYKSVALQTLSNFSICSTQTQLTLATIQMLERDLDFASLRMAQVSSFQLENKRLAQELGRQNQRMKQFQSKYNQSEEKIQKLIAREKQQVMQIKELKQSRTQLMKGELAFKRSQNYRQARFFSTDKSLG